MRFCDLRFAIAFGDLMIYLVCAIVVHCDGRGALVATENGRGALVATENGRVELPLDRKRRGENGLRSGDMSPRMGGRNKCDPPAFLPKSISKWLNAIVNRKSQIPKCNRKSQIVNRKSQIPKCNRKSQIVNRKYYHLSTTHYQLPTTHYISILSPCFRGWLVVNY